MNILAIADRPAREPLREIISQESVDVICTLGDFDLFDIQELEGISDIPKIGVYGNHCSGTYFEKLGVENMHLEAKEINGVVFGGFEGCVRYKPNPHTIMYTQEEAMELMKDFPRVDIFLSHCPPFGVNDEEEIAHQGFHALRSYVEKRKPHILMHGHTYPTDETIVESLFETKIVYVHQDKIIHI